MKAGSIYILEMSDSETSSSHKFVKHVDATRDLIELVEQRRCLWDRRFPAYRDKVEKEQAWMEISREIEPEFDNLDDAQKNIVANLITKKWNNVRDAYVKSRRGYKGKPYKYSAMMSFLDSLYLKTNRKRALTPEHTAEEEWLEDNIYVDIDDSSDATPKRPRLEAHDDTIITVLSKLIQKEEEEDRAFFKSITPSVKKLSESSKFEFRMEVMKLINSLKIKDRQIMKLKVEANESDSE